MNASDPGQFDLLWRYLDGTLTAAGMEELNRLLSEDPQAGAWLREIAEQAVGLGDIGRRQAWVSRAQEAGGTEPERSGWSSGDLSERLPGIGSRPAGKSSRLAWALPAVFMALFAGLVVRELRFERLAGAPLATLSAASGSVVRQESEGTRKAIQTGEGLRAGSLATEGEGSTAEARFEDGTTLGLAGNTEIAITDGGSGKQILLRQGVLTANVADQPVGRPLRVRTATAEIEVLGTIFTVDAQGEATRVEVGRGKVQVRRLVDGREIEVAAHRRTFASLDSSEAFVAEARTPAPRSWRQRFDRPVLEGWRGAWHPAAGQAPASWGAQPYLAGRQADGTPIMHRGLVGRAPVDTPGQHFVALSPNSVLTLRYRVSGTQKVLVFLSTHEPDGTFGGNFETLIPPLFATPGADDLDDAAWREVVVPLSGFRAVSPGHPSLQDGSEAFLLLISTREAAAGLQVAEVRIHPAETVPAPIP